jgi:hypothetical protein
LSTNPDDPILELFGLKAMAYFKRALRVHDAMCRAYEERTGKQLQRDCPDFTVADHRRASRILRSEKGRPQL